MDQAANLRSIVSKKQTTGLPKINARVIAVTSGKGGVGKTNFTVNLALWLARQQQRVVIIDADFGLANIEVLLNIWPKFSFADVITGKKTIPDVLTEAPYGIKLLSGGTGFRDLANVTDRQMASVLNSFGYLDEISDIILIDTGAGISKSVTNFVKAAGEAVIITTPEPTSISDSYTLIKTIYEPGSYYPEMKIVLNKVDNEKEGVAVYERLRSVTEKFLSLTPKYLGSIVFDNDLVKDVKSQKPVLLNHPNSHYSKSIDSMGRKILDPDAAYLPERTGILAFMRRILRS
ncbi:MAG: MinD/ParA family protein [Clostridiales bacterium]|nr:MinD/ParA family protein [Clostridiales bacterium]